MLDLFVLFHQAKNKKRLLKRSLLVQDMDFKTGRMIFISFSTINKIMFVKIYAPEN